MAMEPSAEIVLDLDRESFQREILELMKKRVPTELGIPEGEVATVGIKVCVRKRMKPDMVHMNHHTSRS
jgi:hypothetical protein